jgi:hypothetical protein
MRAVWVGIAVAVVAALIGLLRRYLLRSRAAAPIDVGPVSEGWLAEQRGRKDA